MTFELINFIVNVTSHRKQNKIFYVYLFYECDKSIGFLRTFLIESIVHVETEGVGSI